MRVSDDLHGFCLQRDLREMKVYKPVVRQNNRAGEWKWGQAKVEELWSISAL